MAASFPRVVGTLVGDIVNGADARTKYGLFFEKLSQKLHWSNEQNLRLFALDLEETGPSGTMARSTTSGGYHAE